MDNLRNIINNIEVARGNQDGYKSSIPLKLILTTEVEIPLGIKADSIEEAEMSLASIVEDLKNRIKTQPIEEVGFNIVELNNYFANLQNLEKILNGLCSSSRINRKDMCP